MGSIYFRIHYSKEIQFPGNGSKILSDVNELIGLVKRQLL